MLSINRIWCLFKAELQLKCIYVSRRIFPPYLSKCLKYIDLNNLFKWPLSLLWQIPRLTYFNARNWVIHDLLLHKGGFCDTFAKKLFPEFLCTIPVPASPKMDTPSAVMCVLHQRKHSIKFLSYEFVRFFCLFFKSFCSTPYIFDRLGALCLQYFFLLKNNF